MWLDIQNNKQNPPVNTPVLVCYLSKFVGEMTENITVAYFLKDRGWFLCDNPKPLKGVIKWQELPELPYDKRFRIRTKEFDSKFSIDSLGVVIDKVVLRKKTKEPEPDNKAAKAESLVNLQRKFCGEPYDEEETFNQKVKVIKSSRRKGLITRVPRS